MSNAQIEKNKSLLYFLSCLAIINLLLLSGINIESYLQKDKVLGAQVTVYNPTDDLEKERDFWKTFLSQNPNYLDGWLQLSKLESDLGNYPDSEKYFKIAETIDPSSEKVIR